MPQANASLATNTKRHPLKNLNIRVYNTKRFIKYLVDSHLKEQLMFKQYIFSILYLKPIEAFI